MSRTLVIAEPGATAEGRYEAMLQLIRVAAQAGCDVFKAQWTSDPAKMCARRKAPDYERFYRWLAFPVEWHETLAAACKEHGIDYACTVYLPEDVATIAPHVELFKVSSFEALDLDFLKAHEPFLADRQLLISTGMGLDPANAPWPWYGWVEQLAPAIAFLRCVSAYPAPISGLHLRLIQDDDLMGCSGLSDHSRHLLAGALAAAAGADYIETHFRLYDCDPANPDYAVSFDPGELTHYVQNIRTAETMLGDECAPLLDESEKPMLRYRVGA